MESATESDGTSPRADLWGGIVWIAIGLVIFWGSWIMDRLPHFHIEFYTVPGLLPGILGLIIALMGVILLGRAIRAGALESIVPRHFALIDHRSEEHTSELQSLMRNSYAVFCLKKKNHYKKKININKS